jgi:serine/threonine protein kinase
MGERIGRYEIIEHLATGGMGNIYLARATGLAGFERYVVVKTLDLDVTETDDRVDMFLDEARVVAQMHHQHIAAVHDVGRDDDGTFFLVMEYVHGRNGFEVWQRAHEIGAALPLDFVLTVVASAASALHYAHTRTRGGTSLGIVHRDVTPSNLVIGHDGSVKLIDFGIAKAAERATATQAGFIKGKIGYLAPEQIKGRADQRTDIFALGCVLYELSTMHRAFRSGSDLATLERIERGEYVAPSAVVPGFSRSLERVIEKALALDPANRFQDAEEMRRALVALGLELGLVLGDLAITEVMTQLFEDRDEPWQAVPHEVADAPTMPVADLAPRISEVPTSLFGARPPAAESLQAPVPSLQEAQRSRSRRPMWATLVTLTLVAAAFVGVELLSGKFLDRPASASAPAQPAGPPLALVPHLASLVPPPPAVLEAPPLPPLPATITLRITTSPSDATLLLDGDRLGHTPFETTLPATRGPHVLKVRRRGYAPQRIDVDLSADLIREIPLVATSPAS